MINLLRLTSSATWIVQPLRAGTVMAQGEAGRQGLAVAAASRDIAGEMP